MARCPKNAFPVIKKRQQFLKMHNQFARLVFLRQTCKAKTVGVMIFRNFKGDTRKQAVKIFTIQDVFCCQFDQRLEIKKAFFSTKLKYTFS